VELLFLEGRRLDIRAAHKIGPFPWSGSSGFLIICSWPFKELDEDEILGEGASLSMMDSCSGISFTSSSYLPEHQWKEKERCSGSYRQTEWFLVIKDASISKRPS
jgi:hypothetical protein